ncbi:hypothetical protein MMC22_007259 [Lobaria immixta]|nr:hypothetical protein [Lobaria immixta]
MACDQYIRSSWFTPNSSQPDFTRAFTLESSVNVSWWGGAPSIVNQPQNWRLLLGWFSDDNAESASSKSHSNEMTTGPEGWLFTSGRSWNPSWGMHVVDTCGFTELGMQWDIARDIDISSNQRFKIFAMSQTDPNETITMTSPGFLLLPSTVSSTSGSVSTAASHSSNGTSQTPPTPSDTHIKVASTAASTSSATPDPKLSGLSSGVKAGIGVSCTLLACSILLGAFFFFMRRQRQQPAYKIEPFSFSIPELDGKAAAETHDLDEQHWY